MAIVRTRRIIDDAGADAVLAAAERDGERARPPRRDRGRRPVGRARSSCAAPPGAQIASSRVAVDKARTAAIFVRPSREMEEQVTGGRLGALALHGASALTGGIPLTRRRRGRRRDRHERRDARRGRGDLARRRGGRLLGRRGPGAHLRGRALAAEAAGAEAARRGVAPVDLRRRRRRRADVPRAPRPRAGRERRGHDRQGAHGRDLPPAEQGLRGPGVRRAAVGAAPRARRAAPGRRSRSSTTAT